MNRSICRLACFAALATGMVCSPLFAQQAVPVRAKSPYRVLAPGVIQSVGPQRQLSESFSRHDVVELLAVDPNFDWAKQRTFRHDVWTLEFKFKPMRMIWVDMPQPSGYMQRKLIWYMIYSVTNRAVQQRIIGPDDPEPLPKYGCLHPIESPDGTYKVQAVNRPIRFIPEFLLQNLENPDLTTVRPDRVIPVAVGPIRMREDPNRRFFNSAQISQGRIAVGKTAWGVATWDNVDPLIDRFAVYVKGLTNAYKWQDNPGEYRKGAQVQSYRRFLQKTLKLNFWRPGDEYYEHEREIRYGIPSEVDYEWVYR